MTSTSAYLPFKKKHIIEINGLDPQAIKASAKKRIKKDREKIGHTTILNFVSKSLGFKGGIQGYQKQYQDDLLPFLHKHDLSKQSDLVTLRKAGFDCKMLRLTRERISQRIFNSGYSLPKQIFTGYNFDYENTIDDLAYNFRILFDDLGKSISNLGYHHQFAKNIKAIDDIKDSEISIGSKKRSLQDLFIGGYLWELLPGFNLLSDLLIQPRVNENNIIQLYQSDENDKDFLTSKRQYDSVTSLFKNRIDNQELGWVSVIPYNENLVFLKGQNGEYDYLIKGQKDHKFVHKVFDNNLKISDVPYFIDSYNFEKWAYFEYAGWKELDTHESERHYYLTGGTQQEYPGESEILQSYLKSKLLYTQKGIRTISQMPEQKDFISINILNSNIYVSNPVSINEFFEFLKDRPDYVEYRSGENIANVNADKDLSLPVSCTWYDALAFCKWFEEKNGLPVRLPTIEEYKELRHLAGEIIPNLTKSRSEGYYQGFQYRKDLEYSDDDSAYIGHPPYMHPEKFDALKLRFKPTLKFLRTDQGLVFVDSNDFSEWNLEESCIRSGNLKGFTGNDQIRRDALLECTGKYKHQKIGFRLCLDVKPN